MPISEEEASFRSSIFKALRKLLFATGDIINFEYKSDTAPFKLTIIDAGISYWNWMDIEVRNHILNFCLYRRLITSDAPRAPSTYELTPTTKFEPFSLLDTGFRIVLDLMNVTQYFQVLLQRDPSSKGEVTEVSAPVELPAGHQFQLIKVTLISATGIQKNSVLSFVIRLPEKTPERVTEENQIRGALRELVDMFIEYDQKYKRNWEVRLVK